MIAYWSTTRVRHPPPLSRRNRIKALVDEQTKASISPPLHSGILINTTGFISYGITLTA